jgi:hypothetical protein
VKQSFVPVEMRTDEGSKVRYAELAVRAQMWTRPLTALARRGNSGAKEGGFLLHGEGRKRAEASLLAEIKTYHAASLSVSQQLVI